MSRKAEVEHTKGLPKFRDVVKRSHAVLRKKTPDSAVVELEWDLSDTAKKHQIFKISMSYGGRKFSSYVSRQEFEHYLRSV